MGRLLKTDKWAQLPGFLVAKVWGGIKNFHVGHGPSQAAAAGPGSTREKHSYFPLAHTP